MFRRKFNFSLKIIQEEVRWNMGVSLVVTEGMASVWNIIFYCIQPFPAISGETDF